MLAAEGTGVLGLVLSRRDRGRGRVEVAISRWRVTAVPGGSTADKAGLPDQMSNGRKQPETDGSQMARRAAALPQWPTDGVDGGLEFISFRNRCCP